MIPVKLTLKNFMCYKEATLDLDGVHIACLSGDNGAGKSALLDAITWALWGKARASDDELIAQGQVEMQTDFEFQINEQYYRIVRTRTRKGAGHTDLNFQINKAELPTRDWRNISGSTKKATQDEIIKALRMEYETFINSAFLLQGRADEFTNHTPGERKKVLADILGLTYYDGLEAQAKEGAKDAEQRRKNLDERLKELAEQLSHRPEYLAQKKKATESLEIYNKTLSESATRLDELEQLLTLLQTKEQHRQENVKRLGQTRTELSELVGLIHRNKIETENCQRIIADRDRIEDGYRRWQDADAEHERLLQKFNRYEKLIKERRRLEDIVRQTETKLLGEQSAKQTLLAEAQAQGRNLPTLEKEYAGLEKDLEGATQASEQLEQKKTERHQLQTELAGLSGETKLLSDQLKQIERLANQVPPIGERCDRCGTVLSKEAHDHTVDEYRKEWKNQQTTLKDKKQNQKLLEDQVASYEQILRDLAVPARRSAALQKQAGELSAKLTQARQNGQKATEYETRLGELTVQLDAKAFCQAERDGLAQIQTEITALGYDPEAYQRVKERLNSLKGFTDEKNRLDQAARDLLRLEPEALRYAQNEKRLKTQERDQQAQNERLAVEVADLPRLTAERDATRRQRDEAQFGVTAHEKQLWDAEAKLKHCDELTADKKRKEADHAEAAQQNAIFKELGEAFGKKGVQALIIETVLPELEDETNKLLGDMSNGRMNVRFETQRDSKKGDAIETLDLKISDESGVRAYELFSGGEAFRINFAVRVALSKLLARRNGAALRTLFIDEGFGSQDGSGRERLVEAIRSIEQDFERVLVITHIQELKDVFPIRIDVVKTPTGSQISIN